MELSSLMFFLCFRKELSELEKKNTLIFLEIEVSSLKLKKLIFQKELPKPQKPKIVILVQKKVMSKFF